MSRSFTSTLLLSSFCVFAASCTSSSSDNGSSGGGGGGPVNGGGGSGGGSGSSVVLDGIDLDGDPDGDRIVDLPTSAGSLYLDVFSRYAAVETSQGRIHLLAQDSVSNEKIRRAREIMAQHLAPVAGTAQGADKSDVITAMVNRGSTIAIFNDSSSIDLNNAAVRDFLVDASPTGVSIPANRIILEGSSEYMAAMPSEDNTFGVLAALVYKSGLVPARAGYAGELADLATDAIASGAYTPNPDIPAAELDDVYLAVAMDVHSGVFGHDPEGNGTVSSTAGTYTGGISRDTLAAGDPEVLDWIERFFATDHTFEVLLPESFSGNFDCLRRGYNPYTARSEHLRNIELQGTNAAEIFAAPFDSVMRGNAGNNNLKGRRGFDTLYGGDGFDTAVFSGPRADYTVQILSDRVIVEDVLGGHEQTDILFGMERLQFTDGGENL